MNTNVRALEAWIWQKEGVRICIKASRDFVVGSYERKYRAPGKKTVSWLLETRIRTLIGDLEIDVINGSGELVPGQTLINTVRSSYRE